jgi:hypothetical protein
MRSRSLAVAAVIAGLAVVTLAQRLMPVVGPPLYDGVIVEDPYEWFAPPAGFAGGAQQATAAVPIQGSQSPNLSVGTPEQPPQAQVFAGAGYLVMPAGTSSINVSIVPGQATTSPADGIIAGNVYRFSLTSQSGAPVRGQASGGVTIVLRGPANLSTATIERLSGGIWTPLQTDPAGAPNMFTAVVTDFGDFAIVTPQGWAPVPGGGEGPVNVGPAAPQASTSSDGLGQPSGASGSGSPEVLIAGLVIGLAIVAAAVALLLLRNKRPPQTIGSPARQPPGRQRQAPPRRLGPKRRRR